MKTPILLFFLLTCAGCSTPAVAPSFATPSSPPSYRLIKQADCFSTGSVGEVFKVMEKPPSILNFSRTEFEALIQNTLASSLTGTETVQLKITTVFFASQKTCLYQLYATQALDEKVLADLQLVMNEKLSIRPGMQGTTRPLNSIGETQVEIVGGAVKSFRHLNYGFAAAR